MHTIAKQNLPLRGDQLVHVLTGARLVEAGYLLPRLASDIDRLAPGDNRGEINVKSLVWKAS